MALRFDLVGETSIEVTLVFGRLFCAVELGFCLALMLAGLVRPIDVRPPSAGTVSRHGLGLIKA